MSNLIKCKLCGSLHEMEEMYEVNTNTNAEFYVCNACIHNREIFKCSHCGNYYTFDYYWGNYDGTSICTRCEIRYFVCEHCGGVFRDSEINYDEDADANFCSDCMEERHRNLDELIQDYYYKPEPIFYGESDENAYLGIELEVDNTSGNYDNRLIYDAAESVLDNYGELLYLKHDGSLSRGFEIVSHPCTLKYHYNSFGWQEIMDICKNGTLRSHDTSTCGLHIHLSRNFFGDSQEIQDLHISKLIILVSKFYDSHLLKFSRRKSNELRWCENPAIVCENTDTEHTIVDKMKQFKSRGRYMAVNLENQNTIEFRLFKGTLNFNTFIASLQFVMEISRYAMRTELKHIPTTNWSDIFIHTKFTELKNYLKEKELI